MVVETLPNDKPLEGAVLSPRALRHAVVKHLLHKIFVGRLPAGERLVVQKLSAEFGISSTPLRESLVELESVGVIEISHNRGATVMPFGRSELQEIYQLRRILENEATRAACGHIDQAKLERLRGEIQAQADDPTESPTWSAAVMETDLRLHEAIAANCGSRRLGREIRRYNTLVQTIREIVGNQHSAQERAVRDHLAIVNALLAGNADGAAGHMSDHINHTAEDVAAVMFGEKS